MQINTLENNNEKLILTTNEPNIKYDNTNKAHLSSKMVDFFDNKSVLITGGNGFVGKVLMEKLLRTCCGLDKVFVLLRPKRNKSAAERLAELLECDLFEIIRNRKLIDKIVLIEGDICSKNLGLSKEQLAQVTRNVSIVFHSAATVKFDEKLHLSVKTNIDGTQNIIDISRQMQKLVAIVHVSTAYANCTKKIIDEHIYPTTEHPLQLSELANWLDGDVLESIKKPLLDNWPNTYTYTKAISEYLLFETARDLPIAICRPSIVLGSWREPFSGWIDNVNGPTGVILGAMKGVVRSIAVKKELIADFVPVDVVANMIVSLAWFAHEYHKTKNQKALVNKYCDQTNDAVSLALKTKSSQTQNTLAQKQNDALNNNVDHKQNNNEHNNQTNNTNYNCRTKQQSSSFDKLELEIGDDGYSSPGSQSQSSVLTTNATVAEDRVDVIGERMRNFRRDQNKKLAAKNLPETLADLPVFHCTTGTKNPITWNKFSQLALDSTQAYPPLHCFRYPTQIYTKSILLDLIFHIFLHLIPAYCIDIILKLIGKKPVFIKLFEKFSRSCSVLKVFTTNQWTFNNDNCVCLIDKFMSNRDKELLDFDVAKINWTKYVTDYVLGCRKHILNEDIDNVQIARQNMNKTWWRNTALLSVSISTFVYYAIITPISSFVFHF